MSVTSRSSTKMTIHPFILKHITNVYEELKAEWNRLLNMNKNINHKLECRQLTCQFPTWRSPILCSFDRDNSMYEQQTWMLTLGLLHRNTGCQCYSVRCSSMLTSPMHINSHTKFQLGFSKFQFSTVRTVKRVELHHYAKFRRNRLNCSRDMVIFRFLRWRPPSSWIFKIWNV